MALFWIVCWSWYSPVSTFCRRNYTYRVLIRMWGNFCRFMFKYLQRTNDRFPAPTWSTQLAAIFLGSANCHPYTVPPEYSTHLLAFLPTSMPPLYSFQCTIVLRRQPSLYFAQHTFHWHPIGPEHLWWSLVTRAMTNLLGNFFVLCNI